MKLALIIGVCAVFFTSIFSAGYDEKPGTPQK
ncbi:hypothetical protein FHS45_003823 [Thalassobacillus devorans]|nr:hypothetical protein [Thalassobacillus devorans]